MIRLPIPDTVLPDVLSLRPEGLREGGIRLLLVDLDNTLGKYGQPDPAPEILAWRREMEAAGITLFLLSNSRKPARTARWASALSAPFLGHAGKPGRRGYLQAMEQMGAAPEETAMVGDQIYTDIWGARRSGVAAILVEPLELRGNPGRYLRYAAETPFRILGKRRQRV